MRVITTIAEMQAITTHALSGQQTIGFVPTMGFLHEGHMSLLEQARQDNDVVVLSIFVNPLQFGPGEDLATYPRDFERDSELARQAKVDYLFFPSVSEMYPTKPTVTVKVEERVDVLCGKSRPGHFDGVATVLTKLFHIIQPTRAYFGLKDAQQVAVVEGLVSDFHFPVELVPLETVREREGLAKSSRNVRLSEQERKEAPVLYQSLRLAEQLIQAGERSAETIKEQMTQLILENCRADIDYIEILSYPNLTSVENIQGKTIVALAVKFANARLIDNRIITV